MNCGLNLQVTREVMVMPILKMGVGIVEEDRHFYCARTIPLQ